MEGSANELTIKYIKEHPDIRNCLRKGIINYSSLSRLIVKELQLEKKTTKQAILISARRFKDKLKKELSQEKNIKELLSKSETEMLTKINIYILEKGINLDMIDEIQKTIRKETGKFYILEGSDNYTVITQEKFSNLLEDKFKNRIIKHEGDLVLINIKSSKDVENQRGFISYLTSLFAENGINIREFLSCWTDTLFVISSEDLQKAISFLKF